MHLKPAYMHFPLNLKSSHVLSGFRPVDITLYSVARGSILSCTKFGSWNINLHAIISPLPFIVSFYIFWNRVSLYSLGWPETQDPLASNVWVLGWDSILALTCMASYTYLFFFFFLTQDLLGLTSNSLWTWGWPWTLMLASISCHLLPPF